MSDGFNELGFNIKFQDTPLDLLRSKDIEIDFIGDFLVSGKQVAEILGYSNTAKAVRTHAHEEDVYLLKNSDIPVRDFRKLNNRGEVFINESGLYALIFGSELETSKQFKRWVTSELLPSVRKTGGYVGSTKKFVDYHFQEMDPHDRQIIYALFKTKHEQRKLIDTQKEVIEEQKPKVEKFDRFLNFKKNKKIGTVAKSLSIGPNKLFKFLREQKILMDKKGTSYHNVPYQKHISAEHFVVKPIVLNKGKKAKTFETNITLVTKKGMNYIYKKINDANAWEDLK